MKAPRSYAAVEVNVSDISGTAMPLYPLKARAFTLMINKRYLRQRLAIEREAIQST